MLNSSNEPGGASDVLGYGSGSEGSSGFHDLLPPSGGVTSIDVRSLPPGTELVVDTRNSQYHFVMLDGGGSDALVQGSDSFRQETKVRINGSALGGSVLRSGWLVWGLSLEISVGGQRIATSRVHSIRVEIKPVVTFSNIGVS